MKIKASFVKNQNIKAKATDKSIVLAFVSVATGIITGGVLFAFNRDYCSAEISDLFLSFINRFSSESDFQILLEMLFSKFIYFAVVFIAGTSIVGKEIILAYTVINFSSLSMIASYLYSAYNLQGLEYCLLIFYPGKILYILSSLLVIKNALEFSSCLNNKPEEAINSKKRYISAGAIILMIYTASIITDFLLIKIFSSLFSF